MDQSIEKKIELKDKLGNFYNNNKKKIFLLIIIVTLSILILFLLDQKVKKNNILIAEKYIKATSYLSNKDDENAKKIFDEIISSKNKFYTLLALNTILEKNLVTNQNTILEYFEKIEKINFPEETKDLITLKKALYLMKISEVKNANILLESLINKNSNLKAIVEKLIVE